MPGTDEAFRALEEFVALVPSDVDTRLFLAERLGAKERTDDALFYLAEAYRTVAGEGDEDR